MYIIYIMIHVHSEIDKDKQIMTHMYVHRKKTKERDYIYYLSYKHFNIVE